MKVKTLVAPPKVETIAFNEIETVLEKYLQPRKRPVIAEQTKFVAITQRNGESSGDIQARLKETARYCEFGKLKTIADPEAYMIQLRFIAGIQKSEHKLKVLEHLEQNPDAKIDDILLRIHQREQTVQFVDKQKEPNETVSLARNGQLRKKTTGNGKKSTGIHNKAQECPKCGTKHEPRRCPVFGKTCNNCKKPNFFAKMSRMKKQTNHFVGEKANHEENNGSTSDYLYFSGHTDYIKNDTMKTIKVNGKKIHMMKDTGASLTLISKKLWKQTGQPKFEEKNIGIETYDKHKMKYFGVFFSTVVYNNKQVDVNIFVVDAYRIFGLLGGDLLNNSRESIERCFKAEISEKLPTVKGAKVSIKLKPDAKPMFCAARKVLLPLERQVNKTADELILWGILEPVEAGGVDNCSPVVWVRKGDKLQMCAEYKVHVNGKINTEAYPFSCIETIFSKVSGAKLFAKIDLSNA